MLYLCSIVWQLKEWPRHGTDLVCVCLCVLAASSHSSNSFESSGTLVEPHVGVKFDDLLIIVRLFRVVPASLPRHVKLYTHTPHTHTLAQFKPYRLIYSIKGIMRSLTWIHLWGDGGLAGCQLAAFGTDSGDGPHAENFSGWTLTFRRFLHT